MTKISCSIFILLFCFCFVSVFSATSAKMTKLSLFSHIFQVCLLKQNLQHSIQKRFVRRDISASSKKEELHVRALKYLSGRYKSLPVIEAEVAENTTEGTTTMEPFIKVTTTLPPDQLNMKVFGGYFDSLFGKYLADQFNVTTKIYSTPPYAMVHYYFPGASKPPDGSFIAETNIVNCSKTKQFCPPNSTPICLSNGTIYCITPMGSTAQKFIDRFLRDTIETKIKVRCRKQELKLCEKEIPLHVPCYAKVIMVEGDGRTLRNKYVAEYCVTVIAYPVSRLTNEEFLKNIRHSEEGQRGDQFNNFAEVIFKQVFG